MNNKDKIPVCLDTDIGCDIDDTWALALLLNSPEFDIKLITSAIGDTNYGAKIIAKMLIAAGRTDIPIGIGYHSQTGLREPQREWVKDFELDDYPGEIYYNGIEALGQTLAESTSPVTLIAIAPMTNVAMTLEKYPGITRNTNFVTMCGSIYKGHDNSPKPVAEHNVVFDLPAAQKALAASWLTTTIVPLDCCGYIRLQGRLYQQVRNSDSPLLKALIENNDMWMRNTGNSTDIELRTSILYDTAAIYAALRADAIKLENLPIEINDDGFTNISSKGPTMNCAMGWYDYEKFLNWIVKKLTQK